MSMNSRASLATAHLVLRLQPINRTLRAAVESQQIAAARLSRPDLSPLCLTDEHVKVLLEQVEITQSGNALPGSPATQTAEERAAEEDLRAQSAAINYALPLEHLSRKLSLTPFEEETILLCAAPELDRTYEKIYGFILDDLNRRFPCTELLISLTASSIEDRLERRHALNAFGRLRRLSILMPLSDAPTDLRQEFRLGPGIFDYLTGAGVDMSRLCCDRAEIAVPATAEPPAQISPVEFEHLTSALAEGTLSVLGLWGPRQSGVEEFTLSLAAALERPLRRIFLPDLDRPGVDLAQTLQDQLRVAAGVGAIVWFEVDSLADAGRDRLQSLLADAFANSPVPILLTGENPWRPSALVRAGLYAERELSEPLPDVREKVWSQNFPELEKEETDRLAARYRLSGSDIRSIAELARMQTRLAGNGRPEPIKDHVAAACSVVTRRSANHFSVAISPRRRPEDLILPAHLHKQIVEVAHFFQLRSRVDDEWGFGRLASGSGMKVLFTGDPGTGKTLAAEVIAGMLGLPLCKVDLARIVSKWVGETEKNLESAFREAEESHSVLFFDEAEALFGKRAEVQHGTDRYANLEVSYLLQRLESSRGLVILASNVKDQIDSAFVRRFQVVVHFPRPGVPERRRIWQLAFPPNAPLDAELNFETLARLEMTGAAIVSSARTAAMLAADSASATITMAQVIRATARQFRREARVLTPSDLGPYGVLLQGAS
jgi:hypothetical protein